MRRTKNQMGRPTKFPGITRHAKALGVTNGHLYRVLTGERVGPLLARYQELVSAEIEALIKSFKTTSIRLETIEKERLEVEGKVTGGSREGSRKLKALIDQKKRLKHELETAADRCSRDIQALSELGFSSPKPDAPVPVSPPTYQRT